MMALHVARRCRSGCAGSWRSRARSSPPIGFPQADKPPVVLIHGELDQVVDPALSRQAAAELTAAGYDARLHISPSTAHGIAPDGLDFATAFLTQQST